MPTAARDAQRRRGTEPAEPDAAAGAARTSAVGMLGIGDVLARLRGDFPDVSISKIRFLETEGLVKPARTKSGYRKFTLADVERLRYVLAAQRDHYLPLKVIKEHLDALDRGLEPPSALGAPRAPEPLTTQHGLPDATTFVREAGDVRFTRAEILAESGLSPELFDRLHEVGMVAPMHGDHYDADTLAIADAVAGMAAFGFDARHLRSFKSAADREAGLVEQVVAPLLKQRDPDAQRKAAEAARELAAQSVRLHAALVRQALPESLQR
jgi:DNA-binding transcriptional MerR regulator